MKAQLSHYRELIWETREVEGEEIKALEEQRDDIYELHHMNREEFHHMLQEMHSMNETQSDHVRYLQWELTQTIEDSKQTTLKFKEANKYNNEKNMMLLEKGNILNDLINWEQVEYKLNENKWAHLVTQAIAKKIEKR